MGVCATKEAQWQLQAEDFEARALQASGIPVAEWERKYIEITMDGKPFQVRTLMHGDLEAPVLVMTSSFGVSVTSYLLLFKELSDHYRIVLFDNLSIGLNTKSATCSGLEDSIQADEWILSFWE